MFQQRNLINRLHLGAGQEKTLLHIFDQCLSTKPPITKTLPINRVLLVSKLSRYEFEKKLHQNLSDKDLETAIRKRGTDFDKLTYFHDLHKRFEENISRTFKDLDIDVEIVNRFNITQEKIRNCDVVVPVGGDGTFLLAASRVIDNRKPVIGFNSDPNRSEGHLCLPKRFSTNVREAIERLRTGQFEWLLRSRIRTTLMVSDDTDLVPNYLHEIDGTLARVEEPRDKETGKVLPVLALNEVFMGETLSARVSHLQLRLNGSTENTNLKCSGVCISTGTGSTSWHLSINRLPVQSVSELLRLIDIVPANGKENLAKTLSDIYNKNLVFSADEKRMGYTIRDLISAGVWPQPKGIKSRGFASKIEAKSNCFDASLVVDGGVSFPFNDGTIALLEIKPEDALRTVVLTD